MISDINVSVIVPIYNAGELIDRCLDSIFGQKTDRSIEVILVDDGSTDNSVELIRRRLEQDRIRLFQQVNSGPSKARNKGIEEARGKYLAFLDADDYWLQGFINEAARFLDRNKECVAVSVAQRHLTTNGEHEAPSRWNSLAPEEGMVPEDFYKFWADHNHICTGSILIRTEVAKATGGMREDLRLCEDLEYWALLGTYGKIGYIPKLLFGSDGSKVTANIGWVQKHLPRWNNAVPIDEWEKRIVAHYPDIASDPSFVRSKGRIAKNLTYNILLSKRYALAKEQIKKHSHIFPNDKVARLLRIAVRNPLNWLVISRLLVKREYSR